MNYLAHTALSPPEPEIMIGNVIADHVKGREFGHFPKNVARGIKLHRFIDRSFDTHPQLNLLREKLPQGLRRFGGIAIDLWFDHYLAKNWEQMYPTSLLEFQQQTNATLRNHWQLVPNSQTRFLTYLIHEDLFIKYQNSKQVLIQGQLLAKRLTHGENLVECIRLLSNHYSLMQQLFNDIYPFMIQATDNYFNNQLINGT